MAVRPKRGVRRVTIHIPDGDLDTTRVRGIGFRATFADGTSGPVRRTYREARADARAHSTAQAVL